MKNLLIASLLIAVSSIHAGTIKLPGSNITRNAGTSIPVTIQASGFPAGSKATVSLINAKTWVVTPWLFDQPIVNGNNVIQVPIDWSSPEIGTRLVKVQIGNNHCTSTWTVRLRSAVIWPYQGTVYTRGQAGSVTWVPDVYFDGLGIGLFSEPHGFNYWLDTYESPMQDLTLGRFNFIVPPQVVPGTYRFVIGLATDYYEWNEETGELEHLSEQTDETQSERITIR